MIKMYIKFAMLKKIFKQDGKMSETFFCYFKIIEIRFSKLRFF